MSQHSSGCSKATSQYSSRRVANEPKWTSTHYTLLYLKTLQVKPDHNAKRESVRAIVRTQKGPDGGINPAGSVKENDVCINGMYLSYACHFGEAEKSIGSVVEFILKQCMADGGWYRAHTQGRCISRSRGQAGRVVGTR